MTINMLSLGGLALGVGLLVDNAIVVAEATGRLPRGGDGPCHSRARGAARKSRGR